jgi:predicted phage terminase large subunit-like protein
MWKQLKELAAPVTKKVGEKDLTLTLLNGREIVLKGSDRPETLRGVGLGFLVMDEYADMKPEIFDLILRATLMDFEAGCLFIGTPKGKNHFFHLWMKANSGTDPEWEAFHFTSHDNPMVSQKELDAISRDMTAAAKRQEIGASFLAAGGGSFKEDDIIIIDKMPDGPSGSTYIAVDPNGYKEMTGMVGSKLARLDETSIAVVEIRPDGWYVKDIIHGRWGIRETSLHIVRAAQKYRPAGLGVENIDAIKPYLIDQMRRMNIYPTLVPLKHGGQKKTDRIIWALQGRFENGRIKLLKGDWNQAFIDQLLDFPNPLAHDDLPDSVAYIDQLGGTVFQDLTDCVIDDWEPIDAISGY